MASTYSLAVPSQGYFPNHNTCQPCSVCTLRAFQAMDDVYVIEALALYVCAARWSRADPIRDALLGLPICNYSSTAHVVSSNTVAWMLDLEEEVVYMRHGYRRLRSSMELSNAIDARHIINTATFSSVSENGRVHIM